ncbi:hypothetical protein ABID22_003312 [Pontibacter aydingkolensis]|uniref:DUF3857 domain-containing protein n=1 Tax=Pontibacter aydingkolensis TaxID=1911536 RepID=A0ABS7CU88_9BACT|nr:hypothetical protein [Pontibacter aydingkolensis]MBW7467419.1 hypothetical protein [Pontibacter aydingkolensis]
MKKRLLYSLIILFLIDFRPLKAQANLSANSFLVNSFAIGQERENNENPLFRNEEVLAFTLTMDMKEMLKDRGEERSYHSATITYQDKEGKTVTEALKVRVRGNRRRDPTVCNFPPLMLNFKRSTVEKTVFGKVNKLKLVTHCNNEDYVLREYLVYKLYNIVTDVSFRVRLCQIRYEDVAGKRKPEIRYAFLIEDEDDLAERNVATIMPDELLIRMDATDNRTMAKLALFQYMIGNTDWSVPYRHNIMLLYIASYGKPVPVPFDFDYTGLVMAPYATPPPELGISSVRQRLFRGYSIPGDAIAELVPFFNNRKADIYRVYTSNSLLDDKYRKQTIRYLDEFFKIINKPKDFERHILKVGHQNERNVVVVKGLEK